ncbi:protein of unknown function (plasmid) [Cupriavidus taiwanensis]|nr:protein of unknown function [Cupriavidus taiwanensis]
MRGSADLPCPLLRADAPATLSTADRAGRRWHGRAEDSSLSADSSQPRAAIAARHC